MVGKRSKGMGLAKKIAALTLSGCMFFGLGSEAFAATMKDVFDEHFYADSDADLKKAFGYDREALWNHFMTFGLKEGRNMNMFFDVVKYRAQYPDLEKAFGDDWEAYLDHYLTYGAKEGRDTGTVFNAMDYAARYADLEEAFGDDVLALWNHYQTYGRTENRDARDEEVVIAERAAREAAKAAEKAAGGQEKEPDSKPSTGPKDRTERVEHSNGSGWDIIEYDSNGKKIKETCYNADGAVNNTFIYEYGSNGNVKLITMYNANGTKTREEVMDSEGRKRKMIWFNADGTKNREDEYDTNYVWIKGTNYENGEVYSVIVPEYDSAGNIIRTTQTKTDGTKFVQEYGSNGKVIKSISYNADGIMESMSEYDSNGKVMKFFVYNADGTILSMSEYDNGELKKSIYYNADDTQNVAEYKEDGTVIRYTIDKDGNIIESSEG